jgi:hypothetical protein
MPLSDNVLIEEVMGHCGVICVEDIIDSFMKCNQVDSHFEEVRELLWPI